jgi:hypothetical protein
MKIGDKAGKECSDGVHRSCCVSKCTDQNPRSATLNVMRVERIQVSEMMVLLYGTIGQSLSVRQTARVQDQVGKSVNSAMFLGRNFLRCRYPKFTTDISGATMAMSSFHIRSCQNKTYLYFLTKLLQFDTFRTEAFASDL